MDEVTFSHLVTHAASRGYSESYLEEQLSQGWLPTGKRVGSVGGGTHAVYPSWTLRAFNVLIDAKEVQGIRGDGLRFWLWLHGATSWDEVMAGKNVGEATRAYVGAMVAFQFGRLQKIIQFRPGGRPRKDGHPAGVGKYVEQVNRRSGIDGSAIDRYDEVIDTERANRLRGLMNDIGYRAYVELEPLVYRLAGVPLNPDLHRRMAKLYIANAAAVPIDQFGDDLTYVNQNAADFGDSETVGRLVRGGDPGNWDVAKLLSRATSEDWENGRRRLFTAPALLGITFAETVAELSQIRPSLRRQYEFFRHPRLAIRAVIIGGDLCDEQRRRRISEKRARQ